MDEIHYFLYILVLLLVSLKSMIVGSDYSFYKRYKYGKKYTKWYFSRPEFEDDVSK